MVVVMNLSDREMLLGMCRKPERVLVYRQYNSLWLAAKGSGKFCSHCELKVTTGAGGRLSNRFIF